VIQPQGLTPRQYLRAPRLGRGTRIGRAAREAPGPSSASTARSSPSAEREYIDYGPRRPTGHREAEIRLRTRPSSSRGPGHARRGLPAHPGARSPANDLFIVGDAHQRIYRHRATLGKCGIDIRGRARKLRLNYRTTDEIRRFAVALLEGRPIDDLDGGLDDSAGLHVADTRAEGRGPRPEDRRGQATFLGKHVRSSSPPARPRSRSASLDARRTSSNTSRTTPHR
jgi:hypothetical protein